MRIPTTASLQTAMAAAPAAWNGEKRSGMIASPGLLGPADTERDSGAWWWPVLCLALDAGTAYEILSIDIINIDIGSNIGARLQAEQVDTGQGFLFARPLDVEAVGQFLKRFGRVANTAGRAQDRVVDAPSVLN